MKIEQHDVKLATRRGATLSHCHEQEKNLSRPQANKYEQ